MSETRVSRLPWPPLIYMAGIAVSILLHFYYPLPWFSSPLADILFAAGWLALLAVAALFFTSIRTMARAKTTLNPNAVPDHLVTSGPFSFTRNPMYLGMASLYAGLAFIANSPVALILLPVVLLIVQTQVIAREERYLAAKFGESYLDYKRRVRRWL